MKQPDGEKTHATVPVQIVFFVYTKIRAVSKNCVFIEILMINNIVLAKTILYFPSCRSLGNPSLLGQLLCALYLCTYMSSILITEILLHTVLQHLLLEK
jgi:hypothetical protein